MAQYPACLFEHDGVALSIISWPTTAIRNLRPDLADAGSGVFSMFRQAGAVLRSAAIAATMQMMLDRQFPHGTAGLDPALIAAGYSSALGRSLYLPAAVLVFGLVTSLFLTTTGQPEPAQQEGTRQPVSCLRQTAPRSGA